MSIAAGITGGGNTAAGAIGAGAGAAVGAASSVAGAVANGVNSVLNAVAGIRVPAFLVCVKPLEAIGMVPFDFNPDEIQISRTGQMTPRTQLHPQGADTGSTGPIPRKVDLPKVQLSKVVFEGLTTKWRCDQLMRWMSPMSTLPAAVGGLTGASIEVAMPVITFSWGPPMAAFLFDGRITSLSINYKRFNNMGIPIRAEVTISLQQVPSLLASLPTNPTSGGMPGRRTHTVIDGDSLQSIATANYGKPGLWRQIAQVNRISNPSSVRPGTRLYLPNSDELDGSLA